MSKPLKLDLSPRKGSASCHRPEVKVWDDRTVVAVSIGPLAGEQLRFVDLTPAEARLLAQMLEVMAATVELGGDEDDD
jgi:hypothetical protein